MRLLYVAMTRAKEKLVISGVITKDAETMKNMYDYVHNEKLTTYYALKAINYFEWILPILLRHPDMADLRELAGIDTNKGIIQPGEHEKSNWKLTYKTLFEAIDDAVWKQETSDKEVIEKMESLANPFEKLTDDKIATNWLDKEIAKRLEWDYPYNALTKMPVKLTVSELKRLKETEEDGERLYTYIPSLVNKPAFLTGKILPDAAQKGSATHFVLQNLNLDKIRSIMKNFLPGDDNSDQDLLKNSLAELIKEELNLLQTMELISQEEASWVEPDSLACFFISPLGRRMLNALEVKREVPFTMEVDAKDIYDKQNIGDLNEKITLQGIVDCYFLEEDGYVLLDYKTDRVSKDNLAQASKKYDIQIKTYKQAVEKGTGVKVKESYIYFLSAGDCVRMDDSTK